MMESQGRWLPLMKAKERFEKRYATRHAAWEKALSPKKVGRPKKSK
ncbi:MAG: hypothetical protein MUO26_04305 [Methanotrichaceae archaeon]|nr:hypothetical protein [Methanotrichaceae archaeon]